MAQINIPKKISNNQSPKMQLNWWNGARGDVVVKAVRYNSAARGFDSRWCHWNFSVT
jgi:hypothetical protein